MPRICANGERHELHCDYVGPQRFGPRPPRNYAAAMELTAEEVRVLGCLMEKGATTPDHYPLSTNALVNACNQKSNREPVVTYDERTTLDALMNVRQEGLARTNGSGRADKHRHILSDALGLDVDQVALLAVMMLRGPQSAGELKTRTERYPTSHGSGFESLDDIDAVLTGLADGGDPFVVNIGRGSGQSQDRWAHLLGEGVPLPDDVATSSAVADSAGSTLTQRVTELEERLARLEAALGVSNTDTQPDNHADTNPHAEPVPDADPRHNPENSGHPAPDPSRFVED